MTTHSFTLTTGQQEALDQLLAAVNAKSYQDRLLGGPDGFATYDNGSFASWGGQLGVRIGL